MNKQQFIKEYQAFCLAFSLKPQEVVISAGGVLLMVGLRQETDDLDLDIPANRYDQLLHIGEHHKSPMGEYITIKHYSLHRGVDHRIKTTMFEGVCCYSLEEVLKQKQRIKRPHGDPKIEQDRKDIAALQKMLGQ